MYLEHFGLREAPFRITPHTEFFFAGANRGATLEALIYAITHDEGIVKVSGEVGSGKTMLCRMLLEKLPNNVETVYLANPSLSREEILLAIAEELQTPLTESRNHQLLRALQDRLLELFSSGRQVVVMIDEAHAMPPESLEEIRLLSNLETNRHKLLHIVLFGQPELDERLCTPHMRQLKERITHNFALEPLRRNDIGNYLMFRIRAAGYRGPDLFTPGAIQLICNASEGLTRRINILADKALLSAFSENKHQIDRKQVKAAISDAQFNSMRRKNLLSHPWPASFAVVVIVAAAAFLAGNMHSVRPPPTDSSAPMTPPAETVAAPAPQHLPQASSEATVILTGVQEPATPVSQDQPPSLEQRIKLTEEWIKTTPDTHYFIQLFSTDANSQRYVELFLENNTRMLDQQQVRVYRSNLSGHDRLGVIYGDYPTRGTAIADLARIASLTQSDNPYIRTVSKLR